MSDIKQLTKRVVKFRDKRGWDKNQGHRPKNLVMSLLVEAGELAEHFTWHNDEKLLDYIDKNKEKISDELADVLYHVLLLSHDLDIDLIQAFEKKMKKNEKKYPVF